jgi:hypothetical protein
MKGRTEKQVVDRFLAELGQPLPPEQIERATSRVRDRLAAGDLRVLTSSSTAPSQPVFALNWAAIAAGIFILLAGGLVALIQPATANVVARSTGGELYVGGVPGALPVSAPIEAGRILRAGSRGGVQTLLDRSEIEMGPATELSVVAAKDGVRILLSAGNVIVTAAKQRNGHLYVETKDCVVSVVGTVFTVNTEEGGSRVSVIEGKVEVQRGGISQTLLPGQQVATSPVLVPVPLKTEIEWSRSAADLVALFQQSLPQPAVPSRLESQVLRGVVKQSSGEGIPDVTVTLCANSSSPEGAGETGDGRQLRYFVRGHNDEPQTGEPNRAAFYTTWNGKITWNGAICSNPRSASTDSQGRFQFPDVAAGQYTVVAEREGYLAPPSNPSSAQSPAPAGSLVSSNRWIVAPLGIFNRRDARNVTVEARQAPPEVGLNLIRGGIIAGRIQDSSGRPAVNADVQIVPMPSPPDSPIRSIGIRATTNDRGEYRAYWLAPGEYAVAAQISGSYSVGYSFSIPLKWTAGGETSVSYNPQPGATWFPRGATVSEAKPVAVREGEEVRNIDIVLREVR